jgi:tyrosyl-tRNA synthetase
MNLTIDQRVNLVKQVGEEITTEAELKSLLEKNENLIAYDGFEPSGKIHLAQGIVRAINVNKMIEAGFTFKMLVADWHAWANHKMGGDLEKIQIVGKYFIEVWKASGMNLDKVEFVWASELVKKEGYWDMLMKMSTKVNIPRVLRTTQIMGRSESDTLTASQILYPLMQATDIFMLNARVAQLGMDQRKVNMLARELAEDLNTWKPIIVSHHMMLGLLTPEGKVEGEEAVDRAIRMKMSKSKPDSAIFMQDSVEDVNRKIRQAWAPEGVVEENPILEYCKYIVFNKETKMLIERPDKFGGNVEYISYAELEKDYAEKKLFPLDLKNALAKYINNYLEPVRKHFIENEEARKLKELVDSYQITR